MAKHLSKSQIDRLGDRLRQQEYGEAELRLLDEYRLTFGSAYDLVIERIQRLAGLPVSGRPAKSTTSIIQKLNRESIRLSQMQDIAGCRTVVDNLLDQDRIAQEIASAFEDVTVLDRRVKPSHGYRAVHLVVREYNKTIEVQIRTALQHVWAEMCEKLADMDPAIKYGGGPEDARKALEHASRVIDTVESTEAVLGRAGEGTGPEAEIMRAVAKEVRVLRNEYLNNLQSVINKLMDREEVPD